MNYFQERFGFDHIHLSEGEKVELNQNLSIQDQKRIEFFALISAIITFVFFIFDIIDLYGDHQLYYFIIDLVFFIVSIAILLFSSLNNNYPGYDKIYKAISNTYPFICILWATAIATLNPDSLFNILTFFVTFFLISFFLSPKLKFYIGYFIAYFLIYIGLNILMQHEVFNTAFIALTVGCIITIPFYSSFRSTRKSSIYALMKINQTKKNLQKEIIFKSIELKEINEDLNNEITVRKITENRLREALKHAEMSDNLKSEFLANISHEIRTPINSILGFTEMLTDKNLNEEEKKLFQQYITSNVMFLLSTLDDIFDASLIKNNQIKVIAAPFQVNRFIDTVIYESAGIAVKYNQKQIQFMTHKLENDNIKLNTDEYFLKKAILRLIDNAYKFTTKGKIEFGARLVAKKLEFFIYDTGIGISDEDMEKIFLPFTQVDGSYSRYYGGSGLGLSIVKGIFQELKCEMKIASKKGEGAQITICFSKYLS